MSTTSQLRSLVKQLQSSSTEQEILGLLQTLKEEAHVTEALLRESKAGLAVGKLRTHASKHVADLAKDIVKKWKQVVEHEKLQHGAKSPTTNAATKAPLRRQSTVSAAPATPTTPSAAKQDVRTAKSDGVSIAKSLGDVTREKCLELIYDALALESNYPSEQILMKAKSIESRVLNDHDGVTAAYKSKIRSLFVNLKDKNNPGLRESVVSGDLKVERLCTMTSQDMASEERKAADSKIMQENLFKTLGAEEVQAETDAFQCGRCKQRKCRYRQAQTRSADEPMTTFVTCTVCNNRWKFS